MTAAQDSEETGVRKTSANATLIGRTTRGLLWVSLGLSVLHHTDHVLRVDHSGWPFRAMVTPFTFSLLAYPMILFALFGPPRLFWWRWSLLAIGTAATIYAHSAIESPHMQYAMWANDRSLEPGAGGLHNLLNIRSAGLGILAALVSMALNIVAVAATIMMLLDGLRRGHHREDDATSARSR